ncbi:MAG: type II toxin-antitoxin system YafQ family toxin [Ottowia sp.]|nr:type II toxin-antitoxin system YafQ family toxin [Ottowia sp.]
MRTIEQTAQFKRDHKRERRGQYRGIFEEELLAVVGNLASDMPLAPKYRDHKLTGNWAKYRECHILPDLLLIYRKIDADVRGQPSLWLMRLGSHSELNF